MPRGFCRHTQSPPCPIWTVANPERFSSRARATGSTALVTVTVEHLDAKRSTASPHLVSAATFAINGLGVSIDAPGSDGGKSGSSSWVPVGHCASAPPEEAPSKPQVVCSASKNANIKVAARSSFPGFNGCVAPTQSVAADSWPGSSILSGSGSTDGLSSPSPSIQLATQASYFTVSSRNATVSPSLLSTQLAIESSFSSSPDLPPAGASEPSSGFNPPSSTIFSRASALSSARPVLMNATGSRDKTWSGGTSVPDDTAMSSEITSGPSGFTAPRTIGVPTGFQSGSWNFSLTASGRSTINYSAAPGVLMPFLSESSNSSQTAALSGVVPSGLTLTGVTGNSMGPMPNNWNSSQMVKASSGFVYFGTTGSPTSFILESENAFQTEPASFITSGSIPSRASEGVVGPISINLNSSQPVSVVPGVTGMPDPSHSGRKNSSERMIDPLSSGISSGINQSSVAGEAISRQTGIELSGPAARRPSPIYESSLGVLRRTNPIQQEFVQNGMAMFTFPESIGAFHKRSSHSSKKNPAFEANPSVWTSSSMSRAYCSCNPSRPRLTKRVSRQPNNSSDTQC